MKPRAMPKAPGKRRRHRGKQAANPKPACAEGFQFNVRAGDSRQPALEWDEAPARERPATVLRRPDRAQWAWNRLRHTTVEIVKIGGLSFSCAALHRWGVGVGTMPGIAEGLSPPAIHALWEAFHIGAGAYPPCMGEEERLGLQRALRRLGVGWARAKSSITSCWQDPAVVTAQALGMNAAALDESQLLKAGVLAAFAEAVPNLRSLEASVKHLERAGAGPAETAVRLARRLMLRLKLPLCTVEVRVPPGVGVDDLLRMLDAAPDDVRAAAIARPLAEAGGVLVYLKVPGAEPQPHVVVAGAPDPAAGRTVYVWSRHSFSPAEAVAVYCGRLRSEEPLYGAYVLRWGHRRRWIEGDLPVSRPAKQREMFGGQVVMDPGLYHWPGAYAHLVNCSASEAAAVCTVGPDLVMSVRGGGAPPPRFTELTWWYGDQAAAFITGE